MTPPLLRARIREVVGPPKELLVHHTSAPSGRHLKQIKMLAPTALIASLLYTVQAFPYPQAPSPASNQAEPPQYNIYIPERQQYLRYDFPFLDPYNFVNDKQPYPSVEPQIYLYPGGAPPPGQHFLLQPGAPPQHNFLVPQPHPGPNVILRDPAPAQRPVFVAGYPKPAHIPPIEKDAEEIPTNPGNIPPMHSIGRKPEKIETFNEKDYDKKRSGEAEVLAAADRNPYYGQPLKPGQRFFILNGQHLFSNYPLSQTYPQFNRHNVNLKLSQPDQDFYRNGVTGQIENVARDQPSRINFDNLILLNQPGDLQSSSYVRNVEESEDTGASKGAQFRTAADDEGPYGNLFQFEGNEDAQNDAIVVDARDQEETTSAEAVSDRPSTPSSDKQSAEPTIAQAHPGAVALAGPGGVAAAAPRGNAFAGKEGVAVSSPQATAVAGPSREGTQQQKGRKQNKNSRRQ